MKRLTFLALFVLVFSSFAYAQDQADAGITPDSLLWGLDRALESLQLALTIGDSDKAKVGLEHAAERLAEVKVMVEEKKLDKAEKAKEKHDEEIARVKARIQDIDASNDNAIDDTVGLESDVVEQENEIEDIEKELEIKIKGQLTVEQRAALDALIASFKNSNNEVRIEINSKKEEIKIKVKEKTGKSDDEIDDDFERAENKTGLNLLKKDKAEEQIKKAKDKLTEFEDDLTGVPGTGFEGDVADVPEVLSQSMKALLNQSRKNVADAQTAFDNGKYGEAYGLANSAEILIKNAIRMLDKEREGKREEGNAGGNSDVKYIKTNPEECKVINFMCIQGYESFTDSKGCGCRKVED